MGKYLRDISIHTHDTQHLPPGKTQRDFNITAHNVQDIFFYQIPKKFEFNGISKLNISITLSPLRSEKLMRYFDGIVEYNYSGFDFEKYFLLSRTEQNLAILKILRTAIEDIGKDTGDKREVLLKITDSILDNDFELKRENKKLSKQTKDKKYNASVSVKVNGEGQNAYVDIFDKDGNHVVHDHLLKNLVYDFWTNLHSSKWDGHTFKILDRDGNVFKQYAVTV
jgi:hypothetical protein